MYRRILVAVENSQSDQTILHHVTQLAKLTNQPPEAIPPFTARPPLAPTPLKLLARDPGAHRFPDDTEK